MANNMYYSILTTVGTEKLAQAIITEPPVKITTIAVGDGNGQFYSPTPDQTQLKRETWRGDINDLRSAEDAVNHVLAEGVVPANVGGWTIREVGLFDDAGGLIAICNYPDTIKPIPTSGSGKQVYIQIHLVIDNVAALELIIDGSIVTASRDYVDNLDQKHRADLAGVDGFKFIGRCPDILTLSTIEPSYDYQHISVVSTLEGWAATYLGEPLAGGEFIYNPTTTREVDGYFIVASPTGKKWVRDVSENDWLTTEMVGIPSGMTIEKGRDFGDISSKLDILSAACKSRNKNLRIKGTNLFISKTWNPPAGIQITGEGVEQTRIFATANFSGEKLINLDYPGQSRYHLSNLAVQGAGNPVIGIHAGGTRLSIIHNVLSQGCLNGGILIRSDSGGDIENLTLSSIWCIDTNAPIKIGVNSGNITDISLRDLQLVAWSSGDKKGIPLEITTNGFPGKQIFGIKVDRVFTSTITGSSHILVDSSGGGSLYGCEINSVTGETHNAAGGIHNIGNEYTVRVVGGKTFNNTFGNLYHNAMNGNGIYVDEAYSNKFIGTRFPLAAASKYFVTCANGARDNHFKDFSLVGAGRRTAGVASLDLLTTQFRGDSLGLNKFSSTELTSEPACIVTIEHFKNIKNGDFSYFPMENKPGVDAINVDQQVNLRIIARTKDTVITIPYSLKAGDKVSLSMKYGTTAFGISFDIAGQRTFTIPSSWGHVDRVMQTEAFNIPSDTETALRITIPAGTVGTFALYNLHLSINGASILTGAKPTTVKQWRDLL